MLRLNALKTLKDNKMRYIAMIVGFFLFVAPFAFLTNAALYLVGNQAEATLHTFCFRMPFDWFFSGRIYMLFGSVAAMFVIAVVVLAFFAGPVFCGWLCPVGAISEGVSRAIPIPNRFRVKIKNTNTTSGLRYGFLLGFILVAIIAAYKLSPAISNVCCRYCASSILQNISSGVFGNPEALAYWHSGGIIVLLGWLVLGGIALYGGRGWCLFFCPLGAVSNIFHKIGARLGMFSIKFHNEKCNKCHQCKVTCPMWAIQEDKKVDKSLCISCGECTHACESGAYSYGRGKENA